MHIVRLRSKEPEVFRYYLADTNTGPYYRVKDGLGMDQIHFVNPLNPAENRVVLDCFQSWPAPSLEEIILRDIRRHNYPLRNEDSPTGLQLVFPPQPAQESAEVLIENPEREITETPEAPEQAG